MWCFFLGALTFYFIALILRSCFCERSAELTNKWFLIPLFLSIIADVVAAIGFYSFFSATPVGSFDGLLTILALLSSGVIAGKFAFTHQDIAESEYIFAFLLSFGFVILFYSLFSAVAYYAGMSANIGGAPNIELVIPPIMLIILWTNTLIDYWDYIESD